MEAQRVQVACQEVSQEVSSKQRVQVACPGLHSSKLGSLVLELTLLSTKIYCKLERISTNMNNFLF